MASGCVCQSTLCDGKSRSLFWYGNCPARWRDGLAESFYAAMSIVTSGKLPQLKNFFGWVGRIGQAFWLVIGIGVFAFFTSTITSVMTTLARHNEISSIQGLADKKVTVRAETSQAKFAKDEGFATYTYPHLEGAIKALRAGRVDAVISGAHVLEYYTVQQPQEKVKVVGRIFNRTKYGFALQHGSPLRRPLTVALLGAIDSGWMDEAKTRYVGPKDYAGN